MSAAQLEKLRSLLKRVEQRKAQPRLRAVPAAASQATAAQAPLQVLADDDDEASDTLPPAANEEELLLDSVAPPADTTPPEADSIPVPAPATQRELPAAAAPASEAPSAPAPRAPTPAPGSRPVVKSPIEDAMALLPDTGMEDSGPLQVQALSEPITMNEREASEAPPAFDPHVAVTHRPEGKPSMPEVTFIPAPTRTGVREPTLEFAVPPHVVPRAMEPVLLERTKAPSEPPAAPSQTIEPAALSGAVSPVRAVSAPRVEAPKSFGELLDHSLSLRPR